MENESEVFSSPAQDSANVIFVMFYYLQLESLREQYEGELASLKRELEEERHRRPADDGGGEGSGQQGEPQAPPPSKVTSKKAKFQSNFLQVCFCVIIHANYTVGQAPCISSFVLTNPFLMELHCNQ